MPLAAILNVILMGFLAAAYWRSLQGAPAMDTSTPALWSTR